MIYRFKSKAGADVILMGVNGEQMLGLIGREAAAQGLIAHETLPAAISALEQSVADDEAAFARLQAEAEAAGEPVPRREGVSLRQRAWPLIGLMNHALKAGEDVLWTA